MRGPACPPPAIFVNTEKSEMETQSKTRAARADDALSRGASWARRFGDAIYLPEAGFSGRRWVAFSGNSPILRAITHANTLLATSLNHGRRTLQYVCASSAVWDVLIQCVIGPGFHPHLPAFKHRFLATTLGASMWFFIFYRARCVYLV